MENSASNSSGCSCSTPATPASPLLTGTKKTARAIPPLLFSILFAFFPKCPVCWAVYMSMFGSLGLARLPYMGWLFPVLLLCLAAHLFLVYRKIPQKGYVPFLLSFAGAIAILSGRTFFPTEKWLLLTGMALIVSGSLFNSFSRDRMSFVVSKTNNH